MKTLNDPISRPMQRAQQRGAASLIVVMVLFFLMSLVAAYTSRNLIFEQRTSVNQYRATQAFEAAEAGLEWALAQLNGGRIGAACLEAGALITNTSFRQRYLDINPVSGMVASRTQSAAGAPPWRAGCIWNGAAWICSCPSDGDPVLPVPVGSGIFPAFWVTFSTVGVTRPGVVQVVANGCTRLNEDCLKSSAESSNIEGRALVSTLVALKSSITTPPAAGMTVVGNVNIGGTLAVYNTEPDRGGITIQAGGMVGGGATDISTFTLRSIPGTPALASIALQDTSLSALAGTPDRVFASMFGAWPNTYKLQPAAVRLPCPDTGCRQALSNAVAFNPDRVIWVEGDLTLETVGDVGSLPDPANPAVAGPAVIVVTGNLLFTGAAAAGGVRIFGVVYTRSGNWTGAGELQGGAFVEGNLASTAAASVVFNGPVIDTLRLRAGSFVRVPGSWRDFP